ncbi:hypothetical protein ACT89R_29525 (plasmid) [Rhodococcus qingshengii]
MPTDPVDDIQPPYIKGFFTILPDAVPIEHKATWMTFVDELEPLLDDAAQSPHDGGPVYEADDGVGRNFVSMRFWQVDDTSESVSEADSRLIGEVVDRLLSDDQKSTEKLDESLKPDFSKYRTVVEMCTFVANSDDLIATAEKPDPLTRCIEALFEFHRSYRILSNFPTEELTYKRLHPMVQTFRRKPDDPKIHMDGIILLNMESLNFGAFTDQIGKTNFGDVQVALSRLKATDPVIAYRERMSDAAYAYRKLGTNAEAVVQLGIACEVLFDGLLSMMLWESGKSPEEAAASFSRDITPRIKNEYTPLLGGAPFNLQAAGPLKTWFDDVAGVRNRVVHANHRPTDEETITAFAAVDGLVTFFGDKLAAKWSKFPLTTFGFIGSDGLAKRGVLSNGANKWIEDNPFSSFLIKLREHSEWRTQMQSYIQRRRSTS